MEAGIPESPCEGMVSPATASEACRAWLAERAAEQMARERTTTQTTTEYMVFGGAPAPEPAAAPSQKEGKKRRNRKSHKRRKNRKGRKAK